MVVFDILFVVYENGDDIFYSSRGVDRELPEDRTIMSVSGEGRRLVDVIRNTHKDDIDPLKRLMFQCAKLYIADPEHPDRYYINTAEVEEIDLNSTAGEVMQKFSERFPGSKKPMVVLKLFYVQNRGSFQVRTNVFSYSFPLEVQLRHKAARDRYNITLDVHRTDLIVDAVGRAMDSYHNNRDFVAYVFPDSPYILAKMRRRFPSKGSIVEHMTTIGDLQDHVRQQNSKNHSLRLEVDLTTIKPKKVKK